MVRVFGRVGVHTATGSEVRFERAKALELVTWQAHHRGRLLRSAARTALWDLDVSDATFANVVSAARRTLDRAVVPGPGGHWLGKTTGDELPLHEAVVSDADLIAAAVDAARGLPPKEAVAVLRPAMDLVDGMPFAGIKLVEQRMDRLRRGVKGRVDIRATSARWAWIEWVLAQGGERAGLAVYDAVKAGGRFADYKRAFEASGVVPSRKRRLMTVSPGE
jgi:hypothetical protein